MPTDVTKNFKWTRVRAKQCAKGSYRITAPNATMRLRFCCPKGRWRRGRCVGGMKLQAKGRAR